MKNNSLIQVLSIIVLVCAPFVYAAFIWNELPDRVPTQAELPEALRRELPTLSFGGAMFSPTPANRMLIVNGQVFREGDKLAPELWLEQIKLKDAVLRYKGQRYSVTF